MTRETNRPDFTSLFFEQATGPEADTDSLILALQIALYLTSGQLPMWEGAIECIGGYMYTQGERYIELLSNDPRVGSDEFIAAFARKAPVAFSTWAKLLIYQAGKP
jgi:hypothetical protein